MTSGVRASAEEEVSSVRLMDVRTLAIDCEQKGIGRRVLSNTGTDGNHNALVCHVTQTLTWGKQDSDRWMRDESRQLAGEGGNNLRPITNSHGSRREHNQAVLPPSLVRWNQLSSSHNSSTEYQPMSTQEGAAPQEMSHYPDSAHTPLHLHIYTTPYRAFTVGCPYW